jgi:sterol desaturase/sphingolipid hydroxylase (fatty acid hydroxylase superfamily)
MPNPIALAIPFFFLLMGVEIFFARRRGLKVYRFSDAIVDLSCGMTQQILLVFSVGVLVGGYTWLYQHRLFDFQKGSLWPWVIAFFAVDFVYYWWHRLSHEVNVLWAVHMVHHQSEDYNLAVALRQAVLSVWTIWPLHLPLALLGVPPVVFLVVDSLSTLYQFWIHTELIGKLGWYEWIFNTPSQHRVHHAVNPRYLDKNYAATLSVWDRLFGTFENEVEQPVYGLVKPLGSFDPMWAQVHYFFDMAKRMRGYRGLDKLRVWLKGPEWDFPPAPRITRAEQKKHSVKLSRAEGIWLAATLLVAIAGTTVLLFNQETMAFPRKAALAAFLLALIASWGFLLDRRLLWRRSAPSEPDAQPRSQPEVEVRTVL